MPQNQYAGGNSEVSLVIGAYEKESHAKNLIAYMQTRFFRFFMTLFMYSHGITKDTYSFIPILDMNKRWTDEALYKRYSLSAEDIAYIESRIRPWEKE